MGLIFKNYSDFCIVGVNSTTPGNGISDINFEGTITIPFYQFNRKVTEIGQYAFCNCINIKEIVVLAELALINQFSIYGCQSLERINIPPSVVFIGYYSFCMHPTSIASGTLIIKFDGISQLSYVDD